MTLTATKASPTVPEPRCQGDSWTERFSCQVFSDHQLNIVCAWNLQGYDMTNSTHLSISYFGTCTLGFSSLGFTAQGLDVRIHVLTMAKRMWTHHWSFTPQPHQQDYQNLADCGGAFACLAVLREQLARFAEIGVSENKGCHCGGPLTKLYRYLGPFGSHESLSLHRPS